MEQLLEVLYKNPELFIKLLDSINDAIFIADPTGKALWVNKTSERMIKLPRDQIIGRNVKDLEEAGAFSPSIIRLALEANKNISTVQVLKDGGQYIATGHLVKNKEGKVLLAVAHSRDITEAVKNTTKLKETELLLEQYSQEIRKMSARKTAFEQNYWERKSIGHENIEKVIKKIANVDTTALIIGETGTGKSLTAKKIHMLSRRKNGPFIEINCAALPEVLLESELFGYEKGSFTGASPKGKSGLIEAAQQGTLFLDEIGELPLSLQAKILHFVQTKTYLPIGAREYRSADIRIIAATNRDLNQMVKEGTFRADLLYRLNTLSLKIPPLRECPEDIDQLSSFFLEKFNQKYHVNKTFSNRVREIFRNYSWPGNIRELENLIERLVILSDEQIEEKDLPRDMRENKDTLLNDINQIDNPTPLPEIIEKIEKQLIIEALTQYKSTRKAAKSLGVTQSLLMRRIKKYNISIQKEIKIES